MLTINKLHSHRVVDFAAEELQKYLRMMAALPQMPIVFDPEATQGFRLGLLSDFGIPFEGEDPELDDVVHNTLGMMVGYGIVRVWRVVKRV